MSTKTVAPKHLTAKPGVATKPKAAAAPRTLPLSAVTIVPEGDP